MHSLNETRPIVFSSMRPRDGDESVGMITISDDEGNTDSTPLQLNEAGPDNQG